MPLIVHDDCLNHMARMEPASVDSIVTDPPYGLAFMGKKWDRGVPGPEFWEAALRVAKPASYLLAFSGTRTWHRLACAVEDAGWLMQDSLMWLHGQGFPKGRGQMKPAWEPVLMFRKPGKGARLQVDACRLKFISDGDKAAAAAAAAAQRLCHADPGAPYGGVGKSGFKDGPGSLGPYLERMEGGRWPANVILDEDAAAMLDAQAGERGGGSATSTSGMKGRGVTRIGSGMKTPRTLAPVGFGDSGGPSRFFYCPKASRSEREAGLREAGLREAGHRGTLGNFPADPGKSGARNVLNGHPTVKPIALMRWLVRLVTPPGGLVLDPFAGSGTTGCAAAIEGFRFIGCEKDGGYSRIAEARIAHHSATRPLWATITQEVAP